MGAIAVVGNDEPTSEEPGAAIEVSIAGGAEAIRIEADRFGLLISNGTRWRQSLTREEAWRLAEAIDQVATRSSNERQG